MPAITEAVTDGAYAAGWSAVKHMPEPAAYALFQRIADRTWAARGKQVLQYEKNLRRVLPDADDEEIMAVSKAGMRSYLQYWCDAFRMPTWGTRRLLDSFNAVGEQYVVDALQAGKGLVIISPHSGNYDHGAAYLAQKYGSMTTVAERLKPDSLFKRFVDFRQGLGMEVRGTGEPGLTDMLRTRVEDNRIVCLVGDRDLSKRGIPVTFFGEATKMPAGAAVVAYRTGAPLHTVNFWYEGRDTWVVVSSPCLLDRTLPEDEWVPAAVQWAADSLAAEIVKHPKDWHMLQKLWLDDLDPARAPEGA